MSYLKFRYCLLFLIFSQPNSAQNKVIHKFLSVEIDKSVHDFKDKKNFYKAYQFFKARNCDSTLIYSLKHLYSRDSNKLLNDYCHYFRGYCFKHKKLYVKAIKEFQLISPKRSFYTEIVNLSKGEIALEQSNFKEGLHYFLALEKIKPKKYVSSSYVFGNIGICYIHLKDFDKANTFLLKSLEELKEEKDTIPIISIYTNLGNMYYEQFKDELAIPYFEKAYSIAAVSKDYAQKSTTAENMSIVEENRDNLKKAIVFIREAQKWKDSLNDQNKVWAVAEAEKKFAIQQKQKEIRLLEIENKLKIAERNSFLFALVVLMLILAAGIYFYIQKVKTNKIITSQKEALKELNATKDKLFSIVSHDLRSSVSVLKTSNSKLLGNLESKEYGELDKLLHQNSAIANSTYNLLDNLLNWSQQQINQLYFEKESLHLYSIVEQVVYNYKPLLFEKNIDLEITLAKDIFLFMDLDSLKIILRNILDNAIKFSNEKEVITIYTQNDNEEFVNLVIEDKGIGMSNTVAQELMKSSGLLSKKENKEIIGTGLGLQLCKTMLQKNGGKLNIETQIGIGTKMILILPKNKVYDFD